MRRRHFLTLSAGTLGLLAQDHNSVRIPLRFFTEDQALDVAAAAARIFPTDASGPGANEANVVIYIDRQLAGPYGRDRYRFTQPPFAIGLPEQGYQGKATPRDIYREAMPQIKGLHQLTLAEQDAALTRIEKTVFFQLLKTHTVEGMFCDPMHGGNANLTGWKLIGFPGPQMSYADEVDRNHGREFRPAPMSLQQILGHPVKPSEDEA